MEVFLSGSNAKSVFSDLHLEKEQIEAEIGSQLDWQGLPQKIGSRILLIKKQVNFDNESEWQGHYSWFKEKIVFL